MNSMKVKEVLGFSVLSVLAGVALTASSANAQVAGRIYSARPDSNWNAVANELMTNFTVTANGASLYGVGPDHAVYRTRANGAWEKITEPAVTSIAVTERGDIYGVGLDHAVYRTRANGTWEKITEPAVTSIAVTELGDIYGVGRDHADYRTRANGAWEKITEPAVTSIAVTELGDIYGVGTDHAVYRTRANGAWEKVTEPAVTSVAVAENGDIYGLEYRVEAPVVANSRNPEFTRSPTIEERHRRADAAYRHYDPTFNYSSPIADANYRKFGIKPRKRPDDAPPLPLDSPTAAERASDRAYREYFRRLDRRGR